MNTDIISIISIGIIFGIVSAASIGLVGIVIQGLLKIMKGGL